MKSIHLFILLCSVAFASAQGDYRFNNFTISNGLSQSFVTTILQDDNASLWIGTQDGLNRFDGKTFEIFSSEDGIGIQNSYIKCSAKTLDGNLWFGTGSGLLLYEPLKDKFTTFTIQQSELLQIESITIDDKQQLWLATVGYGLMRFSPKSKKFKRITASLPSKIDQICYLRNGTFLINSEDDGLFWFKEKTEGLRKIIWKHPQAKRISVHKIVDTQKEVLLGTNYGVFNVNLKTYSAVPMFDKIMAVKNINVTDIVFSTNNYFVATASNGLFTIHKNGNVFNSTEDIFQRNSLLFNGLTCLSKDNSGKIWVGSERGISSFDPYRTGFLSVGPSGNLTKGLPVQNVWCFSEDWSAKFIYVGTDIGISRFNRKTGFFNHFNRVSPSTKHLETGKEVVLSSCVLSQNKLLVGCLDGLYELYIYGNQAFVYKKIRFVPKEIEPKFERVYAIERYSNDLYFLATKAGIVLFNYKTKTSQTFEHNKKDIKNSLTLGICRTIYKDNFGRFWFATSGGGICLLRVENGKLSIIRHPISDKLIAVSKGYVTSVCAIDKNRLWLGTFDSGLIEIQLNNQKIKIVSKKEGLPNNVIYGLVKDNQNRLWVSTNRGLASYNLKTRKMHTYTEVNGLTSNEFNANAYFKSKSGEIFFGGIEGFNFFNPGSLTQSSGNLKVILTKFKLDKGWLKPGEADSPLKQVIFKTKVLELDYKHRSFSFHFHANDLDNPQLINYRFTLTGPNTNDDQEIGSNNELSFNALSPGTYTLKLYARIGDGKWSSEPTTLTIKINSPYWATFWFWLIILSILSLVLYIFVKRRIELARREKVRLEIKIAQRTREIRQQKNQIEEQNKRIEEEKNKVVEQQALLQIEKDKTEKWLNNALPSEAVIELKRNGKVQAHLFKTVTVMFTDVVGFSKISERMNPNQLVNRLDVLFRRFDEIIEANKLEKIKTIGDAYMCAGGIPTENSTNPVDACLAALQIQEYMSKVKFQAIANHEDYWEIRLGINTGAATAGIIGNIRLAYDIWGSTVNLAQRMEMLGEPGKVTITGSTFNYIEPYFECEYKGKVQSKARTWVEMYVVNRIKPELSINSDGIFPNSRFEEIIKLHHFSSIKYYKTEHYVLKILEKNLSKKLYYHSIRHTIDVVKAVEHIALLEGVTDEGLFLLKTAAILHDAGFIEQYDHNESIGARMATEILPKYGYTEQHIKTIVELIHVTEIPHRPINKLQEIICDADLDYLGRDDFEEIADKLRLELREMGKINSDRMWDEIQVKFLRQHQYFTRTAIESRQAKKEANIELVLKRLQENNYVD